MLSWEEDYLQLGDDSGLCHTWNGQFQLMPLRLKVLSCLTTFQILRLVLKQQNVYFQGYMLWYFQTSNVLGSLTPICSEIVKLY